MSLLSIRTALQSHARRLHADKAGVSAIEFAFILPVMLTLFLGSVEMSTALTVNRRVVSVASSAADLTAQVKTVNCPDITDIFNAASSILAPYSITPLRIVLSSIKADATNQTKIAWSKANSGSGRSVGSNFAVPAGLTQAGSSVILSEVTYTYTPDVSVPFLSAATIPMTGTFYLRPRQSPEVTSTCP